MNNLKIRSLTLGSGLAFAAAMAVSMQANAADGISYSYVEADFLVQDIDLYETGRNDDDNAVQDFVEDIDDGDGFALEGSFAFTDYLFGFARYSSADVDFGYVTGTNIRVPSNTKVKTFNLGVGYNLELSDQVDFVARLAYVDVDTGDFTLGARDSDVNDLDTIRDAFDDLNEDSSDGYSLDAGVRAQPLEWLELGGGLKFTDLDTDDDFSVFGNALFEINQNVGINLAADIGDYASTYKLGLRYSF